MRDDDEFSEKIDRDRYLIDRRKVCSFLVKSNSRVSIFSLYRATAASPNNLVRIIQELNAQEIIEIIDGRTIALAMTGRARIVARRREFFLPALNKVWEKVPNEILSRGYIKPVQSWPGLPSSYRKLRILR